MTIFWFATYKFNWIINNFVNIIKFLHAISNKIFTFKEAELDWI